MDSLTNIATPNALGYINWSVGATWILGNNGTFIKTRASTNAFYQGNFAGGISNVPNTANWILRKTATQNPTLITANAYYPNLIFENQAGGIYITNGVGTFFSGNSACNVLGNLEIRSAGINAIIVYDSILTNALIVRGDLIINASGSLVLVGDSIRLEGDLNVNGSLIYSTTSPYARQLNFAGSNNQQVGAGTGLIELYNTAIDKSANNLTLFQPVYLFNRLYFSNGLINTTTANTLEFTQAAQAIGFNNNSFINGPCNKWGNAAFTFPIGKLANLQPLAINASASANPFWTENFNNGCTTGCLASSYSSGNGSWTEVDFSPPGACGTSVTNMWYVSCAENGNAVGTCGTGCGNNATMHVGSQSPSPVLSALCPGGDCGAAYDPGGLCPLLGPPFPSTETDIQMESPLIDCSAQSNITLSFNYIAGGDANDTASLWFYDGATWYWITKFTPLTCGTGQGQWRNYTVAVPNYADYNSNFQIAFRWSNNDDGAGQALSFAVDDIQLTALDIFQSEYFYANPQLVYGTNYETGIHHISACEYWHLNRLNGLGNRQVTLTWDANSCGVTSMPDLRVVRFDNGLTQWRNHGNASTTGALAAGTITTSLISSTFGPYTLASVNGLNPLPVEWLNFNAKKIENHVAINWQALIKPLHQYFMVQRSSDLKSIETISEVHDLQTAGNYVSYSVTDTQPMEQNYYRIVQIDFNGEQAFTEWKKVYFESEKFTAWAYNGNLYFTIEPCCSGQKLQVALIDMFGHQVYANTVKASTANVVRLPDLVKGIYILKIEDGHALWQQKLLLGE
ncbi:MAG TPA: T9SS type A sorting domain-containing protein, partial [Bacteroidia bacterium]|nr:T9SS type A sorting domain-containing protein [Bacteroidia bacterium]